MSITFKELHKDNKIFKKMENVDLEVITPLLKSKHFDEIIATDKMLVKMSELYNKTKFIEDLLQILDLVDSVKISSAVRTWQTHLQIYEHLNKNRKVKLKVPKDSQHLHFEALDLHFFKDGKRIEGKDLLPIYEVIDNNLGDSFVQILSYSWGIHVGLVTTRTKVTFRRRKP